MPLSQTCSSHGSLRLLAPPQAWRQRSANKNYKENRENRETRELELIKAIKSGLLFDKREVAVKFFSSSGDTLLH